MSTVLQDVRLAWRLLARDRTFTATVLLTLAVCIAANTAMLGIVRSVLLEPLPFADSDRIALLYNSYPNAGAPRAGTSVPDYDDRMTAVPALDEVALYRHETMTFGDEHGVERLTSLRATPSFYRLVRVQPLHGRLFRDDEGERGRALKVLLGFAFWHRKFGGDPAVVGRTIRLNGNPFEVVGVLPREFTFLQNSTDVYVPSPIGPADRRDDTRHSNNWQMLGRIKPGTSVSLVRQQVDALNAANAVRFPELRQVLADAGFRTVVVLLKDDVVRDVKAMLYLLWGGVIFVLVIGCVNIANLVIVRWHARRGEMATRQAIGASAGRLAGQIVTETTMLAVAGGGIGALAGWWVLRAIASLDLEQLPRGYEVRLDPSTLGGVLVLSAVVGLALGIVPAFGLRRTNPSLELQSGGRNSTGGRRTRLVRRVLATSQVAIAFVLLVGAGLLLASFRAVLTLDLGFRPEHVVTATVNLPLTAYRDEASLVDFTRRALAAIRARGEVEAAGLVSVVPFSGLLTNSVVLAEGHAMTPGESLLAPSLVSASAGYFESLRIPVLRGRTFDDRDRAGGPLAAIVDERLAKRFWPDADPVGKRLYFPSGNGNVSRITEQTQFFTVVGVVGDVQAADPQTGVTTVGTFYLPIEQAAPRGLTFTVRTRVAPGTIFRAIHQDVARIDPQLPVFRTRRMQEWIDRAFVSRRIPMLIATAFGIAAALLAAIGVFGVLACTVAERRREMGVRLALGSTARGIFVLVLREGATIAGTGLAAGAVGSAAVGRMLKAQLFGVSAMDPVVIGGVAVALAVAALVAILIPSWRASGIDPVVVLGK